ncbi:uncharacterized protein LOC6737881 [Drosophila simulans]|uniref:Uncharacterized protein n=1 Tax=Drosophila simulans TaxID=7240 RepID=A0A0J9RUK4_DROSI|nr:uncharacterized protein LOC6737881 [Drosophila simulans]KMY99322.1 uncharacterized protein Dsimw501_GD12691 [Drosophila simulans]
MGSAKLETMTEYLGLEEKTTIFSLNPYCLYEIFRQIHKNCAIKQTNDIFLKYSDLINFAICCDHLNKAFKKWSLTLYKELCIENTFLNTSICIEINFSNLHSHMYGLSNNEKKMFWINFKHHIMENKQLESLKVIYEPTRYWSDYLERFEELIKSVYGKPKLRELSMNINGFSLEIVPQITQLEKLELNVRLDSRILVELCKLNPNLRKLTLRNSEIFGRLSDIVPHCNQLEYLSFVMKEVDASEYAALANLPQLKALILCGEHLEGSLVKLFSRFQEHQQIQSICIPETYVSNAEAIALASIGSVVSIKCCLRDKSFYSDLPLSGKLTNIYILGHPMQYNPDNPYYNEKEEDFLKVTYRAHRPLAVTRAYYQYWQTKDPKLLQLAFDEDYLHAHRLHCIGWYDANVLPATMQNSSEQFSVSIAGIVLNKKVSISDAELAVLASIPTLTTIRCSFVQIEQIIAVKLQQLDAITDTANRVDKIKTEFCHIRFVHSHESVTLVLEVFVQSMLSYGSILAPLANLRNLKRLEIKGKIMSGSLVELFRALGALEKHTLQELETAFLDPEELEEVVKIKSLRILKSGFFCSRHISELANLEQLEELTLTFHPQGSLIKLFGVLASKQPQVLKRLVIQKTKLTHQEVGHLAGIRSLESLQLGLPEVKYWEQPPKDTKNQAVVNYCQKCRLVPGSFAYENQTHQTDIHTLITAEDEEPLDAQFNFLTQLYGTLTPTHLALLANLPNLKELKMYLNYNTQDAAYLLNTIALQYPENLRTLAFASQNLRFVSLFKDLQSFECIVSHMKDIEYISQLRNLTDLQIDNPLGISLWQLLKEVKVLENLQSLILDNSNLEFLELVEVTKLSWLKRLRLGLAKKQFIFMLIRLEDLEVLEITSTHYAAENESNFLYLFLIRCKNIKSISLYRFYDFLRKDYVNGTLNHIKLFRNPYEHPPFKLRGVWSDFKRFNHLNCYNNEFMELRRQDGSYQSSDESDED